MDRKRNLIFQLFPLSRAIIILLISYFTNSFISGIAIFSLIQFIYYQVITYFLKIIPLLNSDKIFINNKPNEDYTGICYFVTEKGKEKPFIDFFFEEIVKNKEKVRSVITFFFGEFWWKPISYEEAKQKVVINYIDNVIVKSEKDLCDFSQKILKIPIEIHKGILPYEIFVFTNKESLAVIGLKFHHIISDGMGFSATFMSKTNDYKPTIYPYKIQKPNLFQMVLFYIRMLINSPFYLFDLMYTNTIGIDCGPSSFKYQNHNKLIFPKEMQDKDISLSDLSHTEIIKVKNEITSKEQTKVAKNGTLFAHSKPRELYPLISINKHLKITFNDLILSTISSAVSKFYESKGYSKKEIGIIIPINLRGIPDNFEQAKLENNTIGLGVKLPLIHKSLCKEGKHIKKLLSHAYKDIYAVTFGDYLFKFICFFTPELIAKSLYGNTLRKTDLIVSNLAGPRQKVYYGSIPIEGLYPFMTSGLQGSFITINSYNGKFSFSFGVNEGIELNPWEVVEFIEREFDLIKEEYDALYNKKLD